jgi:ribose/xylose/arabinose/galactoside ABC-type transport system permease subunit
MQALTNLNSVVTLLQQNAARIGITAAGLFISIYSIGIMLSSDTTP